MPDIGQRIKKLREAKRLTQRELAKILNISSSTLAMYEIDKRAPSYEILIKLARYFHVTIDYLVGNSENPKGYSSLIDSSSAENIVKIPVFNEIQNANPPLVEEDIIDYIYGPEQKISKGIYFYLKVSNDEMKDARLREGDLVLVHRDAHLENGQIGVFSIEGRTYIRRFFREKELFILIPENNAFEPVVEPPEKVKIIGKVIKAIINI